MPLTITDSQEIIDKVLTSAKLEDILDVNNFKEEYDKIMKKIHPDICNLSGAVGATAKLNSLKDIFKSGTKYFDDAGEFTSNGYFVEFKGNIDLLKKSLANFNLIKSIKDAGAPNFHKYMPETITLDNDKLKIKLDARAVPLSDLTLPQEHVNWILSRMIEFSAWLGQIGYSHSGINPESIFVVPETHGIQVCSFYHVTKLDQKVNTISAKYKNWYPPNLFSTKVASLNVDIELSKKTAIFLLGDKSGSGIKFKKTHNEDFIDFVTQQDYHPKEAYDKYRALLKKNFESKFHILSL